MTKIPVSKAYAKWMAEDAERLNAMAELARKVAVTLPTKDEAEKRAFCPTGPGGGIDNSCSSGGTVTMISRLQAEDKLTDLVSSVRSSLSRSNPSRVLQKSGFSFAKTDKRIDELYRSGDKETRDGIAVSIARMKYAASINPSILETSFRITDRETAAREQNENLPKDYDYRYSADHFKDSNAAYDPTTDSIYLFVPAPDQENFADAKDAGFLASDHPSQIILHEQAHREHYNSLRGSPGPYRSGAELKAARASVEKSAIDFLKNAGNAKRFDREAMLKVSVYSVTNPWEFVAEYAVGVQTGQVRPEPEFDRFVAALGAKPPRKAKSL